MWFVRLRLSVLVVLPVVAGCKVELAVAPEAQVGCQTDADCPNAKRCLTGVGRCVDPTQACVVDSGSELTPVADGSGCTRRDSVEGLCVAGECRLSICGDGFTDAKRGEQCDDGAGNADLTPDACRTTCEEPRCGDGVTDSGEACDDANTDSGDGCRGDCKKSELCGDGEVDANESCDDANDNPSDGCDACANTAWDATVVVGKGFTGGDFAKVKFSRADAVAADLDSNLYLVDSHGCRIWRFDRHANMASVIAGTGLCQQFSPDGALAHSASFGGALAGLTVDRFGDIYFVEGRRIRKIDAATQIISTVVNATGAGCASACAEWGDGGPALQAATAYPSSLALAPNGDLYFTDSMAHVVRVVRKSSGLIANVLGVPFTPGYAGDNEGASEVLLREPKGLAINELDLLIVVDYQNRRIRAWDPLLDLVTTVAGTGVGGPSPDGSMAATSTIGSSSALSPGIGGIALTALGNIIFAEGPLLRGIDADGKLYTIAGGGSSATTVAGVDAPTATIQPSGVAGLPDGSVAFSETVGTSLGKLCLVRNQKVFDLAASPAFDVTPMGQAALSTAIMELGAFDLSPEGDIFIAVTLPGSILRVDHATGDLSLYAGMGTSPASNVDALDAELLYPRGLRVRPNGDVVFVEWSRHVVRRIDAQSRVVTTLAGTLGSSGFSGDGGPATAARLKYPCDLDFDGDDNLYIYDCGNGRIRKVDAQTQVITTIVGGSSFCTCSAPFNSDCTCPSSCPGPTPACGDGELATSAQLADNNAVSNAIPSLVVDGSGNVIFTEPLLRRVRVYTAADQRLNTLAGSGASCSGYPRVCGDGGPASSATFSSFLSGVLIDSDGGLVIADGVLRRLAEISPAATISTVAISELNTLPGGDGGPAGSARGGAVGAVRELDGELYISNYNLVRKIDAGGVIRTVAGQVDPQGDGRAELAELGEPRALVQLPASRFPIADGTTGRVRLLDASAMRLTTLVGYPQGFADAADPNHSARFSRLLADAAGLAFDPGGQALFVSEATGHQIRRVDVSASAPRDWTVETYAGLGVVAYQEGSRDTAGFNAPHGLAYDASRQVLFIADTDNHVIRALSTVTGETSTVAGQPRRNAFFGEGIPAGECYLNAPQALALGPDGSLYVADTGNHRVRRLAPDEAQAISESSIVTTVIGDGSTSASGSGAHASTFGIEAPRGLAFDTHHNLFATSTRSVRLIAAGEDGVPTGDDDVLTIYGSPPRVEYPATVTHCLSGIATVDGDADFFVLDACLGYLVKLHRRVLPVP